MSPAKSKDPSPPKKPTKASTAAGEAKDTGATPKRPKTVAKLDETSAVPDGLSSESDAAATVPATPKVPKVSRAKAKTPATDSAATGSDTQSAATGAAAVPAATPAPDSTTRRAGSKASAVESVPNAIGTRAGDSGNDQKLEAGDSALKAEPAGSPPTPSGPQPTAATTPPPVASPPERATPTPPADAATSTTSAGPVAAVEPPAAPTPAPQPADKPLELPKGALIALRKSGGLKFSSREIVVYPDGRATFDGGDTAKSALTRAARRMSDAQVMRLRRTLDQTKFFTMQPPAVKPDPDGFVIELAARLGGKNNHIEVNAAGMPDSLNALVEQLTALLPSEE